MKFLPILLLLSAFLVRSAFSQDADFQAAFHSLKKAQSGVRPMRIQISATVDGSEKFSFTNDAVKWVHKSWKEPTDVRFDGMAWQSLKNPPPDWAGISQSLDITRAHITGRKGRDVIALEITRDGFDLYLCDSPNGTGHYEVTIEIPAKMEIGKAYPE